MKKIVPIDEKIIDALLTKVEKPARYIGGEWNQINKANDAVAVKVALAFPDVYEIAMSYLGFQILYELINSYPQFKAERCYSPWLDMEQLLRQHDLPLFTLESKTALSDMDVVAITLQHEMAYTNVLNLLDLGKIPVEQDQRLDQHPLVIGGGPCVVNPEPIAAVFDLLVLGDGEDVLVEILEWLQANPAASRQEKIIGLAHLPGVYAPRHYQPRYDQQDKLIAVAPDAGMPYPVRRRIHATVTLPQQPLVPFLSPVHDRVTTQLFRGCTRGCRFCQAGMISRPVREQQPQAVIDHVINSLEQTGYEEVSLTSLSSGDYSQIMPVIKSLMHYCQDHDVALSLPSLRLDSFKSEWAKAINQVRKTGLTFAPEAGSARLRQVINKTMHEETFISSLSQVFQSGWDLIKLYFMIGLPTETDEDITAIVSLVKTILVAAKQARQGQSKKRAPRINLGVNLFIPKPQTPFQWESQLNREQAKTRLSYLAQHLPKATGFTLGKRLDEELNRSYLEAVLARGDRRLWPVLRTAWQQGAKFDSWGDQFDFKIWSKAFNLHGVNPDDYALRPRALDECLPWDHLDYGVTKEFLIREWKKSRLAQTTADCCRSQQCQVCGANDPEKCPLPKVAEMPVAVSGPAQQEHPERPVFRMRLSYQKNNGIRFVGHLDMVNAWRRAAKRAKLPVHYSKGFHPQPSIGFGPPLPVGYIGRQEWMDMGLNTQVDPADLINALNNWLPIGLKVLSAATIGIKEPSLNQIINGGHYQIDLVADQAIKDRIQGRLEQFWQTAFIPIKQWSKKGPVTINARTGVHALEVVPRLAEDELRIKLVHESGQPGTVKLPSLINYMIDGLLDLANIQVTRLAVGYFYQKKFRQLSTDSRQTKLKEV